MVTSSSVRVSYGLVCLVLGVLRVSLLSADIRDYAACHAEGNNTQNEKANFNPNHER
jgi:hypothetical protein